MTDDDEDEIRLEPIVMPTEMRELLDIVSAAINRLATPVPLESQTVGFVLHEMLALASARQVPIGPDYDNECNCEFAPDPDDPEENTPETAWHYLRHCDVCGHDWYALHCVHDGIQNPCPGCGGVHRTLILPMTQL